ncbi:hypothetical protein [Phaeovulum sp.]|uniref:hypothetical protein n=1 Tax=Phaeovulum sp. TaxID=2934796 RepID=UPI00356AECD9
MAQGVPSISQVDPKGLMREAFAIDGITAAECRSIFLDWALSLPAGVDAATAMRAILAEVPEQHAKHPMRAILTEGLTNATAQRGRRGGWAARARD